MTGDERNNLRNEKEQIMTTGIELTGNPFDDYACGKCGSIMYGDEEYCPSCGELNDFANPKKMDDSEMKRRKT